MCYVIAGNKMAFLYLPTALLESSCAMIGSAKSVHVYKIFKLKEILFPLVL